MIETKKSFDAKEHKDKIVEWIRDWFAANGPDCKAVVGISGGKDSTVVAGLCVEALGKDRVVGVLMPNGHQEDYHDAVRVCLALGIDFMTHSIHESYNAIISNMESPIDGNMYGVTASEQTKINLAPRLRMATLYAISQTIGGRVACTDNLSESYIGYSTRWGDNIGDFSPIVNYTASEVIAIGDALGLPQDLVHKTPSDGLCGKTDEDNFGFTYEQLDSFIRTGYSGDEEVDKLIWDKHTKNYFKAVYLPHPYAQLDVHGWV
jgi:NAD+ synthase